MNMGHGWKYVGGAKLIDSKPCKCGKGTIDTYEREEESDYPPFERTSKITEINCENCK